MKMKLDFHPAVTELKAADGRDVFHELIDMGVSVQAVRVEADVRSAKACSLVLECEIPKGLEVEIHDELCGIEVVGDRPGTPEVFGAADGETVKIETKDD